MSRGSTVTSAIAFDITSKGNSGNSRNSGGAAQDHGYEMRLVRVNG